MAENQDEASKEHEPTQRKLDEARKKGELPRSTDLTTACAYGGMLVAAAALGGSSLVALGSLLQVPLDQGVRLVRGGGVLVDVGRRRRLRESSGGGEREKEDE